MKKGVLFCATKNIQTNTQTPKTSKKKIERKNIRRREKKTFQTDRHLQQRKFTPLIKKMLTDDVGEP